jgi:hypothetical protein
MRTVHIHTQHSGYTIATVRATDSRSSATVHISGDGDKWESKFYTRDSENKMEDQTDLEEAIKAAKARVNSYDFTLDWPV